MRALCDVLGITQNMSMAYHPQMDGWSEWANQSVEQFLHIYGNAQQNDWARLLPMAQFVKNSWPNEATGHTPFKLLIGYTPSLQVKHQTTMLPEINRRKEWLQKLREDAQKALLSTQQLLNKQGKCKKGQRHYLPYKEGDQVWLEGTNLCLTHPMAKLAPRRYGPFPIEKVISPEVF